ncbi:hypothetical protein CONSTELLA_125 [Mycobacterium phage Constella]|nr:hypothetical protein CONSTELLA_125 [Mycobacterium phage Constella]
MKYEEAAKIWAARNFGIDARTIKSVKFDLDPGYACCGGTNPDCYCSYAEAPSIEVTIHHPSGGQTKGLGWDMTSILRGLFEISEGE